jgi:hypothetical protein
MSLPEVSLQLYKARELVDTVWLLSMEWFKLVERL